MTPGAVRALQDRVCLAYPKYAQQFAHRKVTGAKVAYRCPFGHGHWHAEALTVEEMVAVAEMLRERGGGASSLVNEGQAR